MLKIYLEELLDECLEEVDPQNALNLVKLEVDFLLEEILEEKAEELMAENYLYYYVWMLSGG